MHCRFSDSIGDIMRISRIAIFILLLVPVYGFSLIGSGIEVGGGGGVTITNIAHDISSSETTNIACSALTPSAGAMILLPVGIAYDTITAPSVSVSGCGLSWNQENIVEGGARRAGAIVKGVGTWSDSGDLSITADDGGEGVFAELAYSINEATENDQTTPLSTVQTDSGTGTGNNMPDVGSTSPGDVVFSVHFDEDANDNLALTAGITLLSKDDDGGDLRAMIVGVDSNANPDTTPGFTSTTSGSFWELGCVVYAQ